jgi:hypothetical protein
MDQDVRRIRHELRGCANTMMLCTSALPHSADHAERLQYIDEVLNATQSIVRLLDELEACSEHTQADCSDEDPLEARRRSGSHVPQ